VEVSKNESGQHYGGISIALHWLVLVAMIVSFITGERLEDGGADASGYAAHVGWAFIFSIPILLRIVWRGIDGFKQTSSQSRGLHLLSRFVMVAFLVVTGVAVVSGLLLPWSHGDALVIASLNISSPVAYEYLPHDLLEGLHGLSSHLWIPLLLLHVLGALKHALIDRDGVFGGIFWPRV